MYVMYIIVNFKYLYYERCITFMCLWKKYKMLLFFLIYQKNELQRKKRRFIIVRVLVISEFVLLLVDYTNILRKKNN